MLVVDTSGLLAAIDGSQRDHAACAAVIAQHTGPFLLSPFVLAELDYLLAARVGRHAQAAFLEEVARGAYQLEPFDSEDVSAAGQLLAKYDAIEPGLADASIVVIAGRHRVRDVLTLDRRHFDVMRQLNGRPFRVWP
ncbi:MAG: PIN domain-containing protein [Cyanobacteria bacterium]|nr:PIN domain-containing protein [Cyanobacteriota bacterium]